MDLFVEWSVGALERNETLVNEAPALVRRCAGVAQAVFPAPDAVLSRLIHAIFTSVRRAAHESRAHKTCSPKHSQVFTGYVSERLNSTRAGKSVADRDKYLSDLAMLYSQYERLNLSHLI